MTGRIQNFEQGIQLCWWILLAVIIAVVVLLRIHFLAIPLERDEGEYAYAGQLMLQGIPPYKLAYNMKLPGIYGAYAAIMALFGQTAAGIHFGLLLVNLLTIMLVFLVARRLLASLGAVTAAGVYALLSLSPSVLGPMAHATHFVLLFALAGIWGLLRFLETEKCLTLFLAGLCMGAGILMKQCGVFFPLFGALLLYRWSLERPVSWNSRLLHGCLYASGVVLPYLATCGALAAAGVFGNFWFWTVSYASQYANELSLADGIQVLRSYALRAAIGDSLPLWILAGLGLVFCPRGGARARDRFLFLAGF